jgi:zinc finger protein 830
MADVRALLKAKRQEARVTHPYAIYNASGALRCAACGAAVKFASAWEGHLGSKAHRVAVTNMKAKEEAASSRAALLKRNAEEQSDEDADDAQMAVDEEMRPPTKRQRTEERELDGTHAAAFPTNFFSDPSRAPPTRLEDDDDDMAEDGAAAAAAAPKSQLDLEWAAFERDLVQTLQQRAPDPQETYARATVAAEPELVPALEGLPGQPAAEQEQEQKVSEDEERRRKLQEEHELIMDRLMDEEREQEEADSRVAVLKSRVEILKKKRELAKAKKAEART